MVISTPKGRLESGSAHLTASTKGHNAFACMRYIRKTCLFFYLYGLGLRALVKHEHPVTSTHTMCFQPL